MNYYVYMLANNTKTTLYVGVTNDLVRRVYEHRQEFDPKSFTSRYHVHQLVYYEATSDVHAAIEREKQIKGWNRRRKNELVTRFNPEWQDLYPSII
jgi:putative endonuclease